ncbi:MAG: hypothetical protein ACFE9Q_12275 [Candidatus Hodarchaeota archaeon]
MANGKIFCIIGGLLTLISTFILAFGYVPITGFGFFGIGFITNMDNIFEDTFSYSILFGGQEIVVYILFVILLIFLVSGFIQLAGIKSRAAAIIGSILPIFISLVFISDFYDVLFPEPLTNITSFFWDLAIAEGVFPVHIPAGTIGMSMQVSLGTYLLLGGGILGVIGGIIGIE